MTQGQKAIAKDIVLDLVIMMAFLIFDVIHTSAFSPTLAGAFLGRTGAKYILKALVRFVVGYVAGTALAKATEAKETVNA